MTRNSPRDQIISVFVLLFAIALPCIAWLLHLLIWQIRLPHKQSRALLLIFMSVLAAFGLSLLNEYVREAIGTENLPFAVIAVTLFHFSAMCGYIITYSAVEVDSPSLLIVMLVEKSLATTKSKVSSVLDDSVLVMPRVRDLLRDGHLTFENGRYQLTEKGRKFASIFVFFRALLRAPKGG